MFHATNFTESRESFFSFDKLMKSCLMLWEKMPILGIDPKTATADDLSELAARLADQVFFEHFGYQRPADFQDQEPGHIATWMFHAVAVQWFGVWSNLAFPRVQMSHSFAAMLMSSTVSAREVPNLEAPWPAFLIEIPEGLLPIVAKNGELSQIRRVHVTSHFLPTAMADGLRWWSVWMSGPGIEIHRVGPLDEVSNTRDREDLAKVPLHRVYTNRVDPIDMPISDATSSDLEFWEGYDRVQEDRVASLVGRLLIGICVFMTQRSNWTEKEVPADKYTANYAKRQGKSPTSRVYTIGKPVDIDFRPAVQEYLTGARGSVTSQSLVAGHHKRQPFGPNGEHRKWIFIQPYWRGPDDGPIVVRPHRGE